MRHLLLASVAALGMLGANSAFAADEAETINEAFANGKATLDLRYRYENVSQVGFAEDANAHTLRTKLKYATGSFKGFSAVLEVENNLVLSNGYNSTINGKGHLPVVADPKSTEINQAYLAYKGIDKTTLMAGRIGLNMANQRFVGTVAGVRTTRLMTQLLPLWSL